MAYYVKVLLWYVAEGTYLAGYLSTCTRIHNIYRHLLKTTSISVPQTHRLMLYTSDIPLALPRYKQNLWCWERLSKYTNGDEMIKIIVGDPSKVSTLQSLLDKLPLDELEFEPNKYKGYRIDVAWHLDGEVDTRVEKM